MNQPLRVLTATGEYRTVRLACTECDRGDHDLITESDLKAAKKSGWENITRYQSYEDSCKIYDTPSDAPQDESYSVFDWYTHLGLCPDCISQGAY